MEAQAQYKKECVGSFPSLKQDARWMLNTFANGQALLFCVEPTYLGITLNRTLTFWRNLESLCKKLTSRVSDFRAINWSS